MTFLEFNSALLPLLVLIILGLGIGLFDIFIFSKIRKRRATKTLAFLRKLNESPSPATNGEVRDYSINSTDSLKARAVSTPDSITIRDTEVTFLAEDLSDEEDTDIVIYDSSARLTPLNNKD